MAVTNENSDTIGQKFGFVKSIKIQLTNKNSLLNFILGIYLMGLVWVFTSLSNTTMSQFGYGDQFVGLIGFCYLLFGSICGTIIIKVFETNTTLGIRVIIFALFWSWFGFFIMITCFGSNSDISSNIYFTVCLVTIYLLNGTFVLTIMGMMLNSCIEVCYPIQEAVSTGNALIISQTVGF